MKDKTHETFLAAYREIENVMHADESRITDFPESAEQFKTRVNQAQQDLTILDEAFRKVFGRKPRRINRGSQDR